MELGALVALWISSVGMASSAEFFLRSCAVLLIWTVRLDRTDQIRSQHESQSKINTAPSIKSRTHRLEIKSGPSDQNERSRLKEPHSSAGKNSAEDVSPIIWQQFLEFKQNIRCNWWEISTLPQTLWFQYEISEFFHYS